MTLLYDSRLNKLESEFSGVGSMGLGTFILFRSESGAMPFAPIPVSRTTVLLKTPRTKEEIITIDSNFNINYPYS